MLSIFDFVERSRANGPGIRAVVWVQGCPRRCPGCWNPDSLPFVTKNLVTVDELESRILAIKGIDGVTFSGGEPFSQAGPLAEFAARLHAKGLTVVCFTGHTLEQIQRAGERKPEWQKLLAQVDLLVDGEYVESFRANEPLRGSANQKIHFLSGRIQPEEVLGTAQRAEFTLGADGQIMTTGFPEFPAGTDALLVELEGILNAPRRGVEE